MDRHQFEQVIHKQFEDCKSVLVQKGREYADEHDMLRNFKIAAGLQGSTPRQALGGMLAKHTVSIYDLINDVQCAPEHIWQEKITDAINYLVLLKGLSVEELEALARFQQAQTEKAPQKPTPTAPSKEQNSRAS